MVDVALNKNQKLGRKAERKIAEFMEDLHPYYIIFRNETELGPIDMVLVNLKTGKSVFIDCKGVDYAPKGRTKGQVHYKKKWKHLPIWFVVYQQNLGVRVIPPVGNKRPVDTDTGRFVSMNDNDALNMLKKALK